MSAIYMHLPTHEHSVLWEVR